MRRVFAASALSSAHHISRLKYANDLSEAMVKVRAEGRRDETLRMVGNELNKRTALALERQENPIVGSHVELAKLLYWNGEHQEANHWFRKAQALGVARTELAFN